ncbi:protein-disulfide reductase DsbD family protein [Terasakiella sp. A23]|uniref:protein-disulfide reductase DsbD family protein n=1 Tax=Terasakiella sp. FCG-A23 TaxID=3080561 RepID=UPI0029539B85|nr:protein-disulfide reductase DsbD domain-containing protein [Terasakiella sp. A23]MDV7339705.1 protein-disulfide reductase DsbD family protein [Terasakiella sp. A23]
MKRFLILLSMALIWAGTALAQSSDWQGIDKTQVRLISSATNLGSGNDLLLGLHFKMEKGWKVYWRSPGDAGYPPEVDWKNSANLMDAQMHWPRPERFEVLGLATLGYKDEVVYPVRVNVTDPSLPLDLDAHVRFLTCDDICIPVEVDLAMALPAGPADASDNAQLINKYNSQVPRSDIGETITLSAPTLYIKDDKKNGTLRLNVATDWELSNPDALMEGPIELAFFKPTLALSEDKKSALIDVPLDGLHFMEGPVTDQDFTLTFMDGMRAVELKTKVTTQDGPLPALKGFRIIGENAAPDLPLATILGLAVLGGLILNLMPCVLPVLSLKVLGLVSHGGANPMTVRLSFLASAAGILFSFLVLAGALIAMKTTGATIGWGIQFQQPLFLIALALIVILFACNMWGFFEINLPGWMSSLGARSESKGLGGHFLTGAFATILATPCSAPFLGTAVGFALSQGSAEILMVFTALGVGLALPYILIALFPGFATRLPKPGNWMVTLRKILALALIATAIWLLTVLMAQIGVNAAIGVAGVLVVMIIALALKRQLKALTTPIVLVLFAAAFTVPVFAQKDQIADAEAEKLWTKFDTTQISTLVENGQIVFVDVTADWCITCQVNKKLVLHQGEPYDVLKSDKVTAMKADWTNPDDEIANYLASFKKFAIPFNAVYGPGAPEGIVLPELLNEEDVLDAISKARG